jgi:hypothetical protein
VKRILLLGAGLAVLALGAGAALLLARPDPLKHFTAERAADAPIVIPPETAASFRAIVCGHTPCVMVEAGGLRFLVGAGADAAAGLAALKLARSDVDALLLTNLSAATIEGLPAVRRTLWLTGRQAPLTVIGPPGVEQVINGANLMMAASDVVEARNAPSGGLSLDGALLQNPGDRPSPREGRMTVFDSGVVSIEAFVSDMPSAGTHWLYRFDVGSESLLVGDCTASEGLIVQASEGAARVAAVLPARNPVMEAGSDTDAACATIMDWPHLQAKTRLTAVLLSPLSPVADTAVAQTAWRAAVKNGATLVPAAPGFILEKTSRGFQVTLPGKAS